MYRLSQSNLSNFTPVSRLFISGPVILLILSIFVRTVTTVFNMASGYSLGLSRTFEAAFSKAGGVLPDNCTTHWNRSIFKASAPCSKRGNDEPALSALTARAQNNIQIAKGPRQNVRNTSI
jgi:hypothetical protein